MIFQNIIPLLSAIIGGVLVIIANYFSQTLIHRNEEKKTMRQIIEEAYDLNTKFYDWLLYSLFFIYKSLNAESEFNERYFLGRSYTKNDSDVNRLIIVIKLYFPKKRDIAEHIIDCANCFSRFSSNIENGLVKIIDMTSEEIEYFEVLAIIHNRQTNEQKTKLIFDKIFNKGSQISTEFMDFLETEIEKQM